MGFLSENGIEIEHRPTTKLNELEYFILLKEFKKDAFKRMATKDVMGELIKSRKLNQLEKEKHKLLKKGAVLEEHTKNQVVELNKAQNKKMINYEEQIINDYKALIVSSGNDSGNPDKGYPKPQCVFVNEYEVIRLNKTLRDEYFPNSGHLIALTNYTRDIKERFESTEFFKLKYQNSKNFFAEDYYSVKYEVVSQSVEKLSLLIDKNIDVVLAKGELELPYKYHSSVYVKTNSKIYGPIAIVDVTEEDVLLEDEMTYKYKVQSLLTSSLGLDKDYEDVIHVFEESGVEKYIINNSYGKNDSEEFYITNTVELLKNIDPIELILNETLDTTIKIIEEKHLPEKENDVVVADLNEANKIRFEKYLESKAKSDKWLSFLENKILSKYLKTNEGKQFVENYVENHREQIIESKIKELNNVAEEKVKEGISNLELEKENIIDSINASKKEKGNLELEIKKLSNERESIILKSDDLEKLINEIESKTKELDLLNDYEAIYNSVEEKEAREKELDIIINNAQNKLKNFEHQEKEIKTELAKTSEDLIIKRIGEIQPYFELMNGSYTKHKENGDIFPLELNGVVFKDSETSLSKLIEDLDNFLQANGRRYRQEEILNIITLYFQNFLVIFSGLPGIGKTSLCNLISQFFTPKKCFLELAVSKGWNSRKVLLGYNNPINNIYQFDEFGFVKTLIKYNKLNPNVPLNILLDEANLSPIEYYWSDFISIYDKSSLERSIKLELKGYEELNVPNNLRFMATINNDHTTERLSPRLIDRAPIITLDSDNLRVFDTPNSVDYTLEGYYDFSEIEKLMNPLVYSLLSKEEEILKEIFKILKDEGAIVISLRKVNSIKKYCSVSRELMLKYTSNQYSHIDYAITQFVLPQLHGQGKAFESMLNELIEVFKKYQLSKSSKTIKKIKEKGAGFQVFSFFN
ncbi:hypothetical protein F6U93_07220 [Tamlana haliotis]|uniref:AAA+ ATPase domain-containing protein n=1 Tax=Pseudotamlana haliotis TaxID=2614804 RepID=A0A6N6MFZ2_9FLAO|nr:hypothetical protein [Tamlana haliotis]KAB1068274.1 hypothetical protein F6U93_07220 [Tamlana haliotis]